MLVAWLDEAPCDVYDSLDLNALPVGGDAGGWSRQVAEQENVAVHNRVVEVGEITSIMRKWRYRLTVRTEPSQGLNTGSIPVSATIFSITYRQIHRDSR